MRQTVVSFEAVEVPPFPPRPKAPPKVSTNQDGEGAQGRTFVVLFDDIRLTPAMAHRPRPRWPISSPTASARATG